VRLPLELPPPRAVDVVTVGLNSIDLLAVVRGYPAANAKAEMLQFAQLPGGQSASAAAALARLGHRVRYVGRVGADDFGRLGLDSLHAEGVDTGAVIAVPGATSQFAVILVDPDAGTRTVIWNRHPGLHMTADDVPARLVADTRVVLVDCHETEAVTAAAARGRAAGARTVVDVEKVRPGIEALLRHIDVIIAAEAFPQAYTGEPTLGAALRALQDATGAAVVCVTLGADGSLARACGHEIRTPAFRVPVADTTGAGDVFRAGFIAGWLAPETGGDLAEILRWANAVAALKCRRLGAWAGSPTRAELHALLATAR
jgi:sulfofructose kinase